MPTLMMLSLLLTPNPIGFELHFLFYVEYDIMFAPLNCT